MKKVKTLKKNDWLSLKEVVWPEKGINGYVYSHEERCNGKIVSILPYTVENDEMKFMLRNEVTPSWISDSPVISSITGGVESKGVFHTVLEELYEEAGYYFESVPALMTRINALGTCYGVKSSDTVYYLFGIDVTGLERSKAEGDGSELEAKAYCYWTDKKGLLDAEDPLVYTLYMRLLNEEGNI